MPVATIGEHLIKLVAGGTLESVQSWSTSFYVKVGTAADAAASQAITDTLVGQLATFFPAWVNGIKGQWQADTTWNSLKGYYRVPNSAVVNHVSVPAVAAISGANVNYMPPLLATVCSLRSTTPGRSGRGRMFIPFTGGPTGADSQVTAAMTGNVGLSTKTMFDSINAAAPAAGGYASFVVGVASFHVGAFYPVRSLVVDSILDVQRRRQDRLISAHTDTRALV
jgi:hypothetical protein